MIKIKTWVACILVTSGLISCKTSGKAEQEEKNTFTRTEQTEALLQNLSSIHKTGFMFGHHDDPLYGVKWEGDENRSDVKSVCGDYPAVMSFDLGHIELGSDKSLDKISFDKIRQEIIAQYKRGGINSLSWHLDNPLTGGSSWDVTDSTVVATILPGGSKHELFLGWLDKVADYMHSLKTEDGTKIPIIFRPWHEHTGSWFWWGQDLCTTEQYKKLWEITYNRLNEKGVDNLLYAYSPGYGYKSMEEYLERYPEGDIIDLIGFDGYQSDKESFIANMDKSLSILTEVGKLHNKPIAVTETGYEAVPDPTWWTNVLLPVVSKYPVSYVLVWRNARERDNHYYAPYPGQVSAADFVKFYNEPNTLFVNDIKNLYKN